MEWCTFISQQDEYFSLEGLRGALHAVSFLEAVDDIFGGNRIIERYGSEYRSADEQRGHRYDRDWAEQRPY